MQTLSQPRAPCACLENFDRWARLEEAAEKTLGQSEEGTLGFVAIGANVL